VNDTLEHTARRIAERGRPALIARLRPAFEEAAAAHKDVLELSEEQIEKMVERAADRADGLQWRRALAGVASEELGIGLGEALGHPAVIRAQAIVGAPSYEESLAALKPQADVEEAAAESPPAAEPQATAAHELAPESAEEAEPIAEPGPEPEPEPDDDSAIPATPPPAFDEDEDTEYRMSAIHVAGVANLAPSETDLELRFSRDGLDVVRESDEATLARIGWQHIRRVEIPKPRARLRRRRVFAQVLVIGDQGEARFEIPGATPEQVEEHLAPVLKRQ
jgi:hypothetical protein